jgi:hypothetical protein
VSALSNQTLLVENHGLLTNCGRISGKQEAPELLLVCRQTAKVGPTPLMNVTERFITSCETTGQPRNQLPPRMLGVSFVRRLSPLSALVMITNPDLREGDTAE